LHSAGKLVKTLTHGSLFYVAVLLGAFHMSTISVLVWNIDLFQRFQL
jgi:hypothetical protein